MLKTSPHVIYVGMYAFKYGPMSVSNVVSCMYVRMSVSNVVSVSDVVQDHSRPTNLCVHLHHH
jgi:hypothetical protein